MADAKKTLGHIIGNLGKDPVKKYVDSLEKNVVELSVAVTMSYGDEGETRWVKVAVWNEGLIDQVMALKKGSKVAAEGVIKVEAYEGKPQYSMNASRIGTWKPFEKSKSDAPTKPKAEETDDDGVPLTW